MQGGCIVCTARCSFGVFTHGHPRSTDLAPIAVAKWICGTADRFDPTGVCRSCRGAWRRAPACTCCSYTCSTTMGRARTYPWTRMRRSHALSRLLVAYSAAPSWADCITNMCGSNLRQAQGNVLISLQRHRIALGALLSRCRAGHRPPQHEHGVRDHKFNWGYTWTKTQLHAAGLVERAKRRGAHRRRRERERKL